MANNAENVSIWCRHHVLQIFTNGFTYECSISKPCPRIEYGPFSQSLRKIVAFSTSQWYLDGLVQERRNSSALAMELRLSCINPLTYYVNCSHFIVHYTLWLILPISFSITAPTIMMYRYLKKTLSGTIRKRSNAIQYWNTEYTNAVMNI